MNDSREFRFPEKEGNYVLVVEFKNSAGSVEYVGNVINPVIGNFLLKKVYLKECERRDIYV